VCVCVCVCKRTQRPTRERATHAKQRSSPQILTNTADFMRFYCI
jgi:hypothetical protein